MFNKVFSKFSKLHQAQHLIDAMHCHNEFTSLLALITHLYILTAAILVLSTSILVLSNFFLKALHFCLEQCIKNKAKVIFCR